MKSHLFSLKICYNIFSFKREFLFNLSTWRFICVLKKNYANFR